MATMRVMATSEVLPRLYTRSDMGPRFLPDLEPVLLPAVSSALRQPLTAPDDIVNVGEATTRVGAVGGAEQRDGLAGDDAAGE